MSQAVAFNPLDPAFIHDPYPAYQLLRHHAPVVYAPEVQAWVLSRYADITAILRDPRLGVDSGNATAFRALPKTDPRLVTLAGMLRRQMLFRDPPEHTRLRGLVNKAFTPKVVDGLRPHMERLMADLLDEAARKSSFDLIADVAFPLPVTVIAVLLGVPPEDHERFRGWSQPLAHTVEPIISEEALLAAGQAAEELSDYLRHLVALKRKSPGEDLISALIHAEEHGGRLDTEELLANAILILVAGHETTVNLIGNGAVALMQHRDQLARLAQQPGLIESAVEELLRFDSPVQITSRIALEDIDLNGNRVEAGTEVMMLVGGANRDEARFADPERLDVAREDNRHLSFGAGPHYCLGAPLARLEGQIALSSLFRRFPGLRLDDRASPLRRPSAVLRGYAKLPVVS